MPKADKPKKQSVLATPYSAERDTTLTRAQRINGYFRDVLSGGKFRYDSNPTLGGYSSGYHEAVITTDTYNFLRRAKDNGNGTHTLPDTASRGSFWADFTGEEVFSDPLNYVLKYADGFRTDTAQTILSASKGRAAGHTGSGIDTGGQADAHNLLRQSILDLLNTHPITKGFSERSVATLLSSITVTSIAPGEVARTVKGGSASLKAGDDARLNYESNRTGSKRKVEAMFQSLKPTEQTFTNSRASRFIDSTQEGVGSSRRRLIPSLRATSPERETRSVAANEVAGGKYLTSPPLLGPSTSAPMNDIEIGMHITSDFRSMRTM